MSCCKRRKPTRLWAWIKWGRNYRLVKVAPFQFKDGTLSYSVHLKGSLWVHRNKDEVFFWGLPKQRVDAGPSWGF